MALEAKAAVIPESILKKRKREEEWNLAKKQELEAKRTKNAEKRKLIFKKAEQYAIEYQKQVGLQEIFPVIVILILSVLTKNGFACLSSMFIHVPVVWVGEGVDSTAAWSQTQRRFLC